MNRQSKHGRALIDLDNVPARVCRAMRAGHHRVAMKNGLIIACSLLCLSLCGCVETGVDSSSEPTTDVADDAGTGTDAPDSSTDGDTQVGATGCSIVDGNVNPETANDSGPLDSGEPNDTYSQALTVVLDGTGTGRIQGSICPTNDMDVYVLGPMAAGDRIRIDLEGQGGLDAEVAIFDDDDNLFILNDNRDVNDLDPFVNEVVRHSGASYYLAVTSAPFSPSSGSYYASIIIGRGEPVPLPNPQPILLNFDGGTITTTSFGTTTVGPFDTADIDPTYAGQTAAVRETIVETVEANYDGIALEVYNSETRPAPTGLTLSTIYFGGRNPQAFGVAQDVDAYNNNPSDSAIVFTEDFTPRVFGQVLAPEELGRAIGNIASHEIGHLVGLNHVVNTTDLMDTSGGADTFLTDQTFQTSPLDWMIWPFGFQDALQLLEETLGLVP